MKKILLAAVLLSLGSFNLQAQESHDEHNNHKHKQFHGEHSLHKHDNKEKHKERFNRAFLECLGKKEGEIIKVKSHRDKEVEKKCVLISVPIKK